MQHADPSSIQSGLKNMYTFNGSVTGQTEGKKAVGLGMEKIEDHNLSWHHAFYRTYDPQIGRMLQVDPLAEEPGLISMSTYNAFLNNPTLYSDPNGDTPPGTEGVMKSGAETVVKRGEEKFVGEVLKNATKKTAGQKLAGFVGFMASKTVGIFSSLMLSSMSTGDGDLNFNNDNLPTTDSNEEESPKPEPSAGDSEGDDLMTLYRGVQNNEDNHKKNVLSLNGIAIPRARNNPTAHYHAQLHNDGVTETSIFTSWTTNEQTANQIAINGDLPNGVVLTKQFRKDQLGPNSPDRFEEGEILVPGMVINAKPKIVTGVK